MGLLSVHRKKDEISSALDGIIKGKKGSRDAYKRINPMRQLKAFYSFYVRMAFEGSFSPILKKRFASNIDSLVTRIYHLIGPCYGNIDHSPGTFPSSEGFLIIRFSRINIYARQSIREQPARKNGTDLIGICDEQHERSRAELGLQRG